MAQELKTPASIPPDLRQRLMECSPWTLKYSEIQPCVGRRAGLLPSTWSVPNSPPKSEQLPPAAPFHTPHSQLQIPPPPSPQSQRDDSSLRPTTETAEAGKGGGPRFSSGRRSRANPKITKITKIKRITVQDTPPPPHSTLRTPNSKFPHPPALRASALTPACGQPLRQPKRERDVDPDFHRGDGVGPTQKSPKSPKSNESQFKTTPPPHSTLRTLNSKFPHPPSPQGQRVDSSPRPTTETAEARKGRGPRFSSGRRGRATPPTRHSGESRNPRTQTNHSSDPPALDTPRLHRLYSLLVPLRHPRRSIAPFSHPRCLAAFRARRGGRFRDSFQVPAKLRPESGPILSRIYRI